MSDTQTSGCKASPGRGLGKSVLTRQTPSLIIYELLKGRDHIVLTSWLPRHAWHREVTQQVPSERTDLLWRGVV